MAIWRNADGLVVRFDADATQPRDPRGEAPGAGYGRWIDVIVDLTKTVATVVYPEWGAIVPANSYIASVEADVLTAITGASALTFGLQKFDGTELDYDGLITGLPALTLGAAVRASMNAASNTGKGALVGTTTVNPGVLVVTTTGQATAGLVSLRVNIYVPKAAPVPVVFGGG